MRSSNLSRDQHGRDSGRRRVELQAGFTMLELLVALLIGLFLMGGLLGLVQSNRRTFSSQNQLAQLQDGERLALTMLTDVIQQAGYFPDPTLNTAASSFPAGTPPGAGNAMATGQSVTGVYAVAAPGDAITVRYTTASGDGLLNCTGQSNTTGSNFTYVNTFSVVVTAGVGQLVCTREDGTQYPLVSGVQSMNVLYGVNTSGSGNNADTYMTATQVQTATAWSHVILAQVTLIYTNPLYVAANPQGQPATFTIQRSIDLMNQSS